MVPEELKKDEEHTPLNNVETVHKPLLDFDDILDSVGSSGKYQKYLLYAFVAPFSFIMPIFVLSNIFMLYEPDHWCKFPHDASTNYTVDKWKELTIPKEIGPDGNMRFSQCSMYKEIRFFDDKESELEIVPCQFGWDYDKKDYERTLPSTFNWVCSKSHYTAQAFTVQSIGNGVGAIVFGYIADRYGRKIVYILTVLMNIVFKLVGLLLPQYYSIFLISQFLMGTCFPIIYVSVFALIAELSSNDYRSKIYSISWVAFVLGITCMPGIAWFFGDWYKIGMFTVPVTLISFIYFYLLPESPRWLFSAGKIDAAEKVLLKIAQVNEINDVETLRSVKKNLVLLDEKSKRRKEGEGEGSKGLFSLFRKKRVALNTILLSIVWSMNSMVYYGITLNTSSMAGNQFLNFVIISLVELPTGFIGGFLVERTGRRWTQVIFFILCCIGFIGAALALTSNSHTIVILFVLLAKFAVGITSLVVTLQATEMFPTQLRSTGTGFASTVGAFSGIAAPSLVYLGKIHFAIPYLGMALFAVIGVFSSACLPETLNQTLPETLDEANSLGKDVKFWSFLPKDYKAGRRRSSVYAPN